MSEMRLTWCRNQRIPPSPFESLLFAQSGDDTVRNNIEMRIAELGSAVDAEVPAVRLQLAR